MSTRARAAATAIVLAGVLALAACGGDEPANDFVMRFLSAR